jgi:hypothetical protein
MATRRFPLLRKAIALAAVLLALTLALQSVSGIVAEREGRLREAERSVPPASRRRRRSSAR